MRATLRVLLVTPDGADFGAVQAALDGCGHELSVAREGGDERVRELVLSAPHDVVIVDAAGVGEAGSAYVEAACSARARRPLVLLAEGPGASAWVGPGVLVAEPGDVDAIVEAVKKAAEAGVDSRRRSAQTGGEGAGSGGSEVGAGSADGGTSGLMPMPTFGPMPTSSLPDNDERFRLAVDASLHGVCILRAMRDMVGRIVDFEISYANEMAEHLFMSPRHRLLRQPLLKAKPEYGRAIFALLVRVTEGGDAIEREMPASGLALSASWIRQLIAPLPHGVALTVVDISSPKRIEGQLQRVLEATLSVVVVLDHRLRVQRLNPAFEELLGWPAEKLLGRSFLRVVHDDDRESMEEALSGVRSGRRVRGFEARCRRRDGRIRWIGWHMVYSAEDGAFYISGADVTRRREADLLLRESESRYRAIIEQHTEMIVRYGVDGVITFANEAFSRCHGMSAEAVVGRLVFGFMNAPMIPDFRRFLLEFSQEESIRTIQCITAGRDAVEGEGDGDDDPDDEWEGDAVRWHEWKVRAIFDDAGRVTAFQQVGWDVTDRKRAVAERNRLEMGLRHAQKMEAVGTLASGVAHDFSNLLTVIFGALDMARQAIDPSHPARSHIDMAEHVATRATGVTNALLTFSQKRSTTKQAVNLAALATDSTKLLRRVMPASITMRTDLGEAADLWVEGDDSQLQQVLMNLALNARDAMPEGGELTIALRPAEHGRDGREGVGLTVQDTGVGMDAATRMRVFEPFFTTKPRGEGTGLGLAIVHGIVADHGGEIEVTASPKRGASFRIWLPLIDPPGDVVDVSSSTAPRSARAGGRILIAEDDSYVRSIVATALRGQGYEVDQAGDGAAAIEAVNATDRRLDLLVLDMDLPQFSGDAVIRHARRSRGDVPIVVITGRAVRGESDDGPVDAGSGDGSPVEGDSEAAAGCPGCVVEARGLDADCRVMYKPFRVAELVACVHAILDAREKGVNEA